MQGQGLPGFRDFYPEDLALRNHIFGIWRTVARRYGFQEYDGPPLEPRELYEQKSGAEIVEQLYWFEDKGNRRVALRPEMTPTANAFDARAAGMRIDRVDDRPVTVAASALGDGAVPRGDGDRLEEASRS